MRVRQWFWLASVALIIGFGLLAYFNRDRWIVWFMSEPSIDEGGQDRRATADEPRVLKLSEQARKNLGLVSKPIGLQSYWRSIQVPGLIVDRPGLSDRGVAAPAAGIVTQVHAFPGDTVREGDHLFTLRLHSESLHVAQTELFKTARETEITLEQKKKMSESGVDKLSPASVLELDLKLRRLAVASQAYRQELLTQGLSPAHLDKIADGKFVSEIDVLAPKPFPNDRQLIAPKTSSPPQTNPSISGPAFEVQELKIDLGQQVQAGQTLCLLANHQSLYIEGHSFRREAPFLEQAAQKGWPLQIEFAEDASSHWPPLQGSFQIRHLANSVDTASRTFAFYVPLTNQSRSYDKDGHTFLVWRFRPGQRVRVHVPVEEFKDVMVLPASAVVREGPEAYVFRQNGDLFDRRPVQVLHEDRLNSVLAPDGNLRPGMYVAQSAAASLNRVLKAQNTSGGLPPGAHFHADGSLHIPGN